ncbi:hypothetical protein [Bradyrhizobium sp. BR 1432]|uniref:hypothetical protein n=1 Tax=Bradyrhizobium sp. BR 1432 TaxID=3447966 RepID=UPI003EE4BD27
MVLQEPKKNFDYVYFIESGLVSRPRIITGANILEKRRCIGFRGAIGASVVSGRHLSTYQLVRVFFPGAARRMRVKDLHRVMIDCHELLETDLSVC